MIYKKHPFPQQQQQQLQQQQQPQLIPKLQQLQPQNTKNTLCPSYAQKSIRQSNEYITTIPEIIHTPAVPWNIA